MSEKNPPYGFADNEWTRLRIVQTPNPSGTGIRIRGPAWGNTFTDCVIEGCETAIDIDSGPLAPPKTGSGTGTVQALLTGVGVAAIAKATGLS